MNKINICLCEKLKINKWKNTTDVIKFAAENTDINENNFEVIFHARKSLLFHSSQPWIKRDSDTFDVTMGAYDGAEICELVGIFMLSLLSKEYSSNNIGLYRDDGLSVFRDISGQQAENNSRNFQRQRFANNHKVLSENI